MHFLHFHTGWEERRYVEEEGREKGEDDNFQVQTSTSNTIFYPNKECILVLFDHWKKIFLSD